MQIAGFVLHEYLKEKNAPHKKHTLPKLLEYRDFSELFSAVIVILKGCLSINSDGHPFCSTLTNQRCTRGTYGTQLFRAQHV